MHRILNTDLALLSLPLIYGQALRHTISLLLTLSRKYIYFPIVNQSQMIAGKCFEFNLNGKCLTNDVFLKLLYYLMGGQASELILAKKFMRFLF